MSNNEHPEEEKKISRPEEQPKKKVKIKKYKLTVMDYITIGFTVLIVLIMIFILLRTIRPDWFQFSSGKTAPTSSISSSATASPSSEPTLSDIGNTYGNFSNNPYVCEIDERLYFTTAGDDLIPYIYVKVGDETRVLLQDNAFSLNVITDPFTYADDTKASAYTIYYLDANGNICYLTDGPIYTDKPFSDKTATKTIYKEGSYRSIAVRGEYLFFIDEDGHVGKMSLVEEEYTVLSQDCYSTLAVYGSNIFALNEADNSLYLLSTVARPAATAEPTIDPSASAEVTATPVPGVDSYEMQIIAEDLTHFCIDGTWIYTVSDNGIVCRSGDGSSRATIGSRKADYINVLNDQIFVISDGMLYTGTKTQYLLGQEIALGAASTSLGINLTEDAVYVYDKVTHGLLVSTLDSETGSYGELVKVELPTVQE